MLLGWEAAGPPHPGGGAGQASCLPSACRVSSVLRATPPGSRRALVLLPVSGRVPMTSLAVSPCRLAAQ